MDVYIKYKMSVSPFAREYVRDVISVIPFERDGFTWVSITSGSEHFSFEIKSACIDTLKCEF